MTDRGLDVIRETFAGLTGLIEDAAEIASVGQGIDSVEEARRQFNLLLKALDRIGQRVRPLERRLG